MIGRLKTVVLDAADMDAEAAFWSEVLGIPIVHRGDDWTTLEGRGVRLAVQLAPDHVPPQWPDPVHPQQLRQGSVLARFVGIASATQSCIPPR